MPQGTPEPATLKPLRWVGEPRDFYPADEIEEEAERASAEITARLDDAEISRIAMRDYPGFPALSASDDERFWIFARALVKGRYQNRITEGLDRVETTLSWDRWRDACREEVERAAGIPFGSLTLELAWELLDVDAAESPSMYPGLKAGRSATYLEALLIHGGILPAITVPGS